MISLQQTPSRQAKLFGNIEYIIGMIITIKSVLLDYGQVNLPGIKMYAVGARGLKWPEFAVIP
jgi:hypothetical protein